MENPSDDWCEYLDSALFATNTAIQNTTKFTPFRIMFGRNPCFPLEAEKMTESVSVETAMEDIDKAEIDDYISDIIEKQKAIFPKVDNNIKVAQEKQKAQYARRKGIVEYSFKIGDKVLRRNMQQKTRKGKKMEDRWLGPDVIVEISKTSCLLKNQSGKILKQRVNLCQLKPFNEANIEQGNHHTAEQGEGIADKKLREQNVKEESNYLKGDNSSGEHKKENSAPSPDVFVPSEQDWEDYFREEWNNDPTVYLSEQLHQAIKTNLRFSTPPMGIIADCIVSDKLRGLLPCAFTTSFIVHSEEDVPILRELVSAHGEPQPAVIVYPQSEAMNMVDENLTIFDVPMASLKLQSENPTIANVVIDHFGTTKGTGKNQCVFDCDKASLDDKNATCKNEKPTESSIVMKTIQQIIERGNSAVNASCRWILEAKIHSYQLYTQSFLSLLMRNGWVSDEVSASYTACIWS